VAQASACAVVLLRWLLFARRRSCRGRHRWWKRPARRTFCAALNDLAASSPAGRLLDYLIVIASPLFPAPLRRWRTPYHPSRTTWTRSLRRAIVLIARSSAHPSRPLYRFASRSPWLDIRRRRCCVLGSPSCAPAVLASSVHLAVRQLARLAFALPLACSPTPGLETSHLGGAIEPGVSLPRLMSAIAQSSRDRADGDHRLSAFPCTTGRALASMTAGCERRSGDRRRARPAHALLADQRYGVFVGSPADILLLAASTSISASATRLLAGEHGQLPRLRPPAPAHARLAVRDRRRATTALASCSRPRLRNPVAALASLYSSASSPHRRPARGCCACGSPTPIASPFRVPCRADPAARAAASRARRVTLTFAV